MLLSRAIANVFRRVTPGRNVVVQAVTCGDCIVSSLNSSCPAQGPPPQTTRRAESMTGPQSRAPYGTTRSSCHPAAANAWPPPPRCGSSRVAHRTARRESFPDTNATHRVYESETQPKSRGSRCKRPTRYGHTSEALCTRTSTVHLPWLLYSYTNRWPAVPMYIWSMR